VTKFIKFFVRIIHIDELKKGVVLPMNAAQGQVKNFLI